MQMGLTRFCHVLMAISSTVMHHVAGQKSSQTSSMGMTMSAVYSLVTRSEFNRTLRHALEQEIGSMNVQLTNL